MTKFRTFLSKMKSKMATLPWHRNQGRIVVNTAEHTFTVDIKKGLTGKYVDCGIKLTLKEAEDIAFNDYDCLFVRYLYV